MPTKRSQDPALSLTSRRRSRNRNGRCMLVPEQGGPDVLEALQAEKRGAMLGGGRLGNLRLGWREFEKRQSLGRKPRDSRIRRGFVTGLEHGKDCKDEDDRSVSMWLGKTMDWIQRTLRPRPLEPRRLRRLVARHLLEGRFGEVNSLRDGRGVLVQLSQAGRGLLRWSA